MARYIERVENLARLIDVSLAAAGGSSHVEEWRTVLAINSDIARFHALGRPATGPEIVRFYVLDDDNPTSIRSGVRGAFENARAVRPLVSAELWSQINVLQKWLRDQTSAALAPWELPRLLNTVKQGCQAHTGIAEGSFYRDEGWCFYQLGRYLERADQTTRMLDARFIHHYGDTPADTLESGPWAAVLHSAAGYHAFRRAHPSGMSPAEIVSFLLFNPAFPRSVGLCIGEADEQLTGLRSRYRLRGGVDALERLDEIKGALFERTAEKLVESGLHDHLDWIQRQIIGVTSALAADFFGAEAGQEQKQVQST